MIASRTTIESKADSKLHFYLDYIIRHGCPQAIHMLTFVLESTYKFVKENRGRQEDLLPPPN